MLEARVFKRFGALDLAIEVSVGAETLVVAGPNGAGKSSMLRLLVGAIRPDGGRIALDGRTLFAERIDVPPEERFIGYVPQDYALFPHLSAADNVGFALAFPNGGPEQVLGTRDGGSHWRLIHAWPGRRRAGKPHCEDGRCGGRSKSSAERRKS